MSYRVIAPLIALLILISNAQAATFDLHKHGLEFIGDSLIKHHESYELEQRLIDSSLVIGNSKRYK